LPSGDHNSTLSFSQENIDIIMRQFDFTCRTFTAAMAFKYQLQHSLFNGSVFIKHNKTLIGAKKVDIKNLTLILEYLQEVTRILQDIKVRYSTIALSLTWFMHLLVCCYREPSQVDLV